MSWEEEKEKEKVMFFFHACPPHLNTHVFGSVVVVAFQSAFHSEKYANNIFLFFKNHF
jgi:hypothetical protein